LQPVALRESLEQVALAKVSFCEGLDGDRLQLRENREASLLLDARGCGRQNGLELQGETVDASEERCKLLDDLEPGSKFALSFDALLIYEECLSPRLHVPLELQIKGNKLAEAGLEVVLFLEDGELLHETLDVGFLNQAAQVQLNEEFLL